MVISFPGCISLPIRTVTETIPRYAMQTTLLPKSVITELEKVNRSFLWNFLQGECKCHPVAWSSMCYPKQASGLGLRSLYQQNLVALARLSWRLLMNSESLWARILMAKYGHLGEGQNPRVKLTCSHSWKSINATRV